MTTPEQTRNLIEALHEQNVERERLFRLIAALAGLLNREVIVETVATILNREAIDNGDCVVFGDIAISFGADNKVKSVYQTVDGENLVARVVIQSDAEVGGET